MLRKIIAFLFLSLFFVQCGNSESVEFESGDIQTTVIADTTTTIFVQEVAETTTTTIYSCEQDDNSSIDFTNIKNVQIFLNKYGFDAGEADGYLGSNTVNAIKEFQEYAGLVPDGDAGPDTINMMNSWTGCETKSTTVPASTTTTVPVNSENVNLQNETLNSYGYQPAISLENSELQYIVRSFDEKNSFCLNNYISSEEYVEYKSLGFPSIYSLYKSEPLISTETTTTITSDNTNNFTIEVVGNGDDKYKFYFVEPFTSAYKVISPSQISVSSGLTTAVFNKNNLTNGYWFYGYADNGSGGIVESSGMREFLVGNELSQNDNNLSSFHKVWLHSNEKLIRDGAYIENNTDIYITYITDTGFNIFTTLNENIDKESKTFKLVDTQNYKVGDAILINEEIMLIETINNEEITVLRGYRNSLKQTHNLSADVYKLVERTDMRGTRGYAIFKGEKGFQFMVNLGIEGYPAKISIKDDCPKDLYSLDLLQVYAWREKGDSTTNVIKARGSESLLSNDKFTIFQGFEDYIFPDIFAFDSSDGSFINTGPKSETLNIGDEIFFNFEGIVSGNNPIKFIEINFKMFPTGTKKTTVRKVIFNPTNGDFIYRNKINSISSSKTFSNNEWEGEYKYQLDSIKVNDGTSEIVFYSNGIQLNLTNGSESQHDVYYLDQFSFIIP